NFIGPPNILPPHPDNVPLGNRQGPVPRGGPQGPPQFFIHFLVLSISYVLATFMETFLFAQKKEEEVIVNKNEALQTELKLLKSQINPHFLFNALNNIYALSAIDSGKTQQSISYLSDMLRYVLYECEQELVSLEKEITYIENYVKLFSLKSSKKYPIETDYKIKNKDIKIAPMLLIPFMENALKHSNVEKIKDTFINIKIDADENSIRFEIENSISQGPKVIDEIGGIGIENVKKRLAILYPNLHELLINETSLAFKVNLNIDLSGNN
ncbi:sensor histidine kinase, partial [Eudoraea sp.]